MLARAQQAAQTAQLTLVELRTRAIAAGMTEDLVDSMDDEMEDADGFLDDIHGLSILRFLRRHPRFIRQVFIDFICKCASDAALVEVPAGNAEPRPEPDPDARACVEHTPQWVHAMQSLPLGELPV